MSDATLADLDRCPHGRHSGDACAGWKGPSDYDGGCRGGYSLGNPYLARGQRIGTAIYGQPILAPHACDAYGCPFTAHEEFTVGERPPGVEGLDGWPEGAPELRAPLALHLPSGTVIRFCGRHAHRLREAQPANHYTEVIAPGAFDSQISRTVPLTAGQGGPVIGQARLVKGPAGEIRIEAEIPGKGPIE